MHYYQNWFNKFSLVEFISKSKNTKIKSNEYLARSLLFFSEELYQLINGSSL